MGPYQHYSTSNGSRRKKRSGRKTWKKRSGRKRRRNKTSTNEHTGPSNRNRPNVLNKKYVYTLLTTVVYSVYGDGKYNKKYDSPTTTHYRRNCSVEKLTWKYKKEREAA